MGTPFAQLAVCNIKTSHVLGLYEHNCPLLGHYYTQYAGSDVDDVIVKVYIVV